MSANANIITFELLGLQLQEPMALFTNWAIASFAFYSFLKLVNEKDAFIKHWRLFFGFLALSMFLGGIGHLFFHYLGIYGKMPSWILGVFAGCHALFALFTNYSSERIQKYKLTVWLYSTIILFLAISMQLFVFIAIDAILKYVLCGIISFYWFKQGIINLRWIGIGVIVLIPSSFIFLLKLSPHLWFNKDDLSHVLMFCCITFFYKGVKNHSVMAVEAQ